MGYQCVMIFSVADGVKTTHAAVCKGGFKGPLATDVCYTPYQLTPNTLTCSVSTTTTCKAFNSAQTASYSGVACNCNYTSLRTDGNCLMF